jgi:hypothetical protein
MKYPKLAISSFLDPEVNVDTAKRMVLEWHRNQEQSLHMFTTIGIFENFSAQKHG